MPDQLAKDLQILLAESKKLRKERDDCWKENMDWLLGKQQLNKPQWKANTVTNFLFSQVMTIVPKLCGNTPEFDIRPEASEMQGQADELTRLIKRILIRNDFDRRQIEFLTNLLVYGIAYYKITFDEGLWGGDGDFRIESVDTRNIYLEPGKMSLRDSNYVFETRNIDKLTLYRMYPDKRAKIDEVFKKAVSKPEQGIESAGRAEIGRHASGPTDPIDTTVEAYIFDQVMKRDGDRESVEIIEAWFYDERTIVDAQKTLHPEGTAKTTKLWANKDEGEKAYPTGRLVTIVGAEVFDDAPNPFPDFPYVDVVNYYIPGYPYSMSELEQVKPLQEQYNIRSNQIFDLLNYTVAPIRLYDARSGLEPDEITNRPDQWIGVTDVQGILQLNSPPIPGSIFDSLLKLQKDIETIMGVREVTQGSVPGDIRSGFAIEQLQEAAEVRLRLKLKIVEGALLDMAKYLTRMIGVFYRPGTHYRDTFDLRGAIPDVFTYTLKVGASLPSSKYSQQQFIQWMFNSKIVDEMYVIENTDIPGKDDLLERMKAVWDARKAAEAGAIAEAQAGGQPPPPPGG